MASFLSNITSTVSNFFSYPANNSNDSGQFVDYTTKSPSNYPKVIMSIDGGGVRGIIPLKIIEEISKRTEMEPCEFIDLAIGTSTGGLLTASYFGRKNDKPLFKASKLEAFWKESAEEIFKERSLIDGIDGLFKAKYKAAGLENVISKVAGEGMSLKNKDDFFCDVIFPSFDATARKAVYLSTFTLVPGMKAEGYQIKTCLRATTSAPYYLPATEVPFENDEDHAFVDGGVFANDPGLVGYAYATKTLGSNVKLLSFGTGKEFSRELYYKDLADAGLIKYGITGILDTMFDGMESSPNQILTDVLGPNYHRFQVLNLDSKKSALDSVDSIPYLEEQAKTWIENNQDVLEKVCFEIKPRAFPNL